MLLSFVSKNVQRCAVYLWIILRHLPTTEISLNHSKNECNTNKTKYFKLNFTDQYIGNRSHSDMLPLVTMKKIVPLYFESALDFSYRVEFDIVCVLYFSFYYIRLDQTLEYEYCDLEYSFVQIIRNIRLSSRYFSLYLFYLDDPSSIVGQDYVMNSRFVWTKMINQPHGGMIVTCHMCAL